jgi:hypothetical protein
MTRGKSVGKKVKEYDGIATPILASSSIDARDVMW